MHEKNLPGDVIFLAGILPVVYLAVRMFLNRNLQQPSLAEDKSREAKSTDSASL